METLTSWASSAGASIAGVANELATKVEKLSEDLQVKQKLVAVGEASEEKFAVLSGTYKALVVAYLTSLANGSPPQPELLDDAFIFSDENGTRPKDFVLSELTYRGRKCAGTVEIFSEGATFGFKMTQTIEFAPGFKLISGRDVGGKRAENVVTFGVITCANGRIVNHQQRGDSLETWKF